MLVDTCDWRESEAICFMVVESIMLKIAVSSLDITIFSCSLSPEVVNQFCLLSRSSRIMILSLVFTFLFLSFSFAFSLPLPLSLTLYHSLCFFLYLYLFLSLSLILCALLWLLLILRSASSQLDKVFAISLSRYKKYFIYSYIYTITILNQLAIQLWQFCRSFRTFSYFN